MSNSHVLNEVILEHEDANVIITDLPPDKHKVVIDRLRPDFYVRFDEIETRYPKELIQQIFEAKGPAWLCDEIAREESPDYTGAALKWQLFSYVAQEKFKTATILDFGCGSGASIVCMARMFPDARFVGVELEEKLLAIAKSRSAFYGLKNVEFHLSADPEKIPSNFQSFDYIVMAGVFEHLLPNERKKLMPQLWNVLKSEGVLFLHETPYRYFPIETHTTGGLPLINYLPDKLAYLVARSFSRRNLSKDSWETMLRNGIRGGSCTEIIGTLKESQYKPEIMDPQNLGVKNRIQLWYLSADKSRFKTAKILIRMFSEMFFKLTSIELVPYLELAIRKGKLPD